MLRNERGADDKEVAAASDEVIYKIEIPANRREWHLCVILPSRQCPVSSPVSRATVRHTQLNTGITVLRYDLLCVEGLTRALQSFRGRTKAPVFKTVRPERPILMKVKPEAGHSGGSGPTPPSGEDTVFRAQIFGPAST